MSYTRRSRSFARACRAVCLEPLGLGFRGFPAASGEPVVPPPFVIELRVGTRGAFVDQAVCRAAA